MRRFLLLLTACVATGAAQDVDIPYRTGGSVTVRMDVARPPQGEGPFPAVVCLHGGGWSMGSKKSLGKIIQELAAAGFVAASVEYRLTPQFHIQDQLSDVTEAVRFLRAHSARWHIDPSRVALMGYSAGAHLALLAGFANRGDDRVQAIVDVSGPADLRDWKMQEAADRQLQATTGKTSDQLVSDLLGQQGRTGKVVEDASPVAQVRPGLPPVLIFQWKADQAVSASQVERLIQALDRAKVQNEAIWFDGKGHAMNGPGVERIVPETIRFLRSVFAR